MLLRTRTHIHTNAIVSYIGHSVKSLNLNFVSCSCTLVSFRFVSFIFLEGEYFGRFGHEKMNTKKIHRHEFSESGPLNELDFFFENIFGVEFCLFWFIVLSDEFKCLCSVCVGLFDIVFYIFAAFVSVSQSVCPFLRLFFSLASVLVVSFVFGLDGMFANLR